jgi:hypothetical protein
LENKIASSHYGLTEASTTNVIDNRGERGKNLTKVLNKADSERYATFSILKRSASKAVQKHVVARLLIEK